MTVQREVKERKLNEFITGSSCSSLVDLPCLTYYVSYIISRSGYKEVRPSFSTPFLFFVIFYTIFNTKLRTTKKRKIEIKNCLGYILKCRCVFSYCFVLCDQILEQEKHVLRLPSWRSRTSDSLPNSKRFVDILDPLNRHFYSFETWIVLLKCPSVGERYNTVTSTSS